jgi:hypothetical protein
VRSFIVVSNHPVFGHRADFSERSEQVQIKQFISIGSIEAFDVRVLCCFAQLAFTLAYEASSMNDAPDRIETNSGKTAGD